MRSRLVTALGALVLLVPATLAAQAPTGYPIRFMMNASWFEPDTVYAALPGGTFDAGVYSTDLRGTSFGVGSYAVRIYFDATKLAFVSARSSCPDSTTYPITATPSASYVELSASGCSVANYTINKYRIATVQFQVQPGAVDGTLLRLHPVSVVDRTSTNRTGDAVGWISEACVASGQWGDIDGDAVVNSRDALIALTHAVGLPTGAFDAATGDVDGDGIVSSRDALGMLSTSLGYPPGSGFRTGKLIVGRCAPQAVLPRTLYFDRNDAGSGLMVRAPNDSAAAVAAGNNADYLGTYSWRPRPSPADGTVLYVCMYLGYPRVCRANGDGTGVAFATATWSSNTDQSPDWSPDGSQVVFVRDGQLYTMLADGTGVQQVGTGIGATSVAWQPVADSRRVAYTTSAGEVRTIHLDSSFTSTVVFSTGANPYTFNPRMVEWSPAGDSLAFSLGVDGYLNVAVTDTGASSPYALRVALFNTVSTDHPMDPLWTDEGMFFTLKQGYASGLARYRILVLRPDGTIQRVGREPGPSGADHLASGMRRTP